MVGKEDKRTKYRWDTQKTKRQYISYQQYDNYIQYKCSKPETGSLLSVESLPEVEIYTKKNTKIWEQEDKKPNDSAWTPESSHA